MYICVHASFYNKAMEAINVRAKKIKLKS
jgi:hypothetical protein